MTEGENKQRPIPESWVWTKIDKIGEIITGRTPSKKNPENYGKYMPFVKPPQLLDSIITEADDNVSERGAKLARILPPKSILVSCIGILGKTGINKIPVAFNQQINAITVSENIFPEFILYYFQTSEMKKWLYKIASATTIPIVNKSKFSRASVPLAPFHEQGRIVNKLEELFTRLDAGVKSLQNTKAQLQLYRQAILKHAFNGKLTEKWRKTHKNTIQPATTLLEHILNEKHLNWEKTQIEKMQAKGKRFKSNKWKSKYHRPAKVDENNLPNLPDRWVWTNFEQLAEDVPNAIKAGPFGSALKKSFYVKKGYKIYGQEQVIRGDPFYGDYYINEERYQQLKSCTVKSGDILISLVGTIGKVLILPEGIERGIINPRLIKLSLDERLVNQKFIKFYLKSSQAINYFSLSSHGGTMKILNLTILKKLPISLPPLEEQKIILEHIESYFSIADEVEKTTEHSISQSEHLRQSILKTAFEGKLVAQDPSDEPAERLLERINKKNEEIRRRDQGQKGKISKRSQRRLDGYVE